MCLPIAFAQIHGRQVPALLADVFGLADPAGGPRVRRHFEETIVRVLLPVPVARQVQQAPEASLALAQFTLGSALLRPAGPQRQHDECEREDVTLLNDAAVQVGHARERPVTQRGTDDSNHGDDKIGDDDGAYRRFLRAPHRKGKNRQHHEVVRPEVSRRHGEGSNRHGAGQQHRDVANDEGRMLAPPGEDQRRDDHQANGVPQPPKDGARRRFNPGGPAVRNQRTGADCGRYGAHSQCYGYEQYDHVTNAGMIGPEVEPAADNPRAEHGEHRVGERHEHGGTP